MRAAPATAIVMSAFWRWRLFVVCVWSLTCGILAAWRLVPIVSTPLLAVAILGSAALAAMLAARASRHRPFELRWNGFEWRLREEQRSQCIGDVQIKIDLGSWLLLRFVPGESQPGGIRWLPMQRSGREAHWHLFRAAVYSPRPRPPNETPAS